MLNDARPDVRAEFTVLRGQTTRAVRRRTSRRREGRGKEGELRGESKHGEIIKAERERAIRLGIWRLSPGTGRGDLSHGISETKESR